MIHILFTLHMIPKSITKAFKNWSINTSNLFLLFALSTCIPKVYVVEEIYALPPFLFLTIETSQC